VPQLVAAGHQVTGTTRSATKADAIRAAGAEAAVVDGLDAIGVGEVVAKAEPEVVIHQMTALSGDFDLRHFARTFATTNELRTTGLDNLLAAAQAAGARRIIAQSFAGFPTVKSGGPVKTEDDPYDPNPPADMRSALEAIKYLERTVVAAPLEGIVLRYGPLYGPGSSDVMVDIVKRRQMPVVGNGAGVWSFLHVQDAASAAVAALDRGAPGIYNVADDEPAPVSVWLPVLAKSVGAKPPWRVPAWLGRLMAGEAAVSLMTQVRGASNAKAKRELGWAPAWPTWRDGFVRGLYATAGEGGTAR